MAEQIRSYFEILDELLLLGNNSALDKYTKVRFTQYEMNLWWKFGLPLKEVDKKAKRYFSVRFLGEGIRIDKASESQLTKAFEKLGYAVGKDGPSANPTGCHTRCLKLVHEMNEVLKANGLAEISDPEKFLDLLTFDYEVRTDELGTVIEEKPYHFEVRVFHDADNRKEFRSVLKMLKADNRMMSMQDIWRIVNHKKKHSKPVK